MKKLIAFILAMMMLLSLCACGSAAGLPQAEEPAAEEPAEDKGTEIDLNAALEQDYVSMTFESAEILGLITSVRDGAGVTKKPAAGNKYLAILGTVKNSGTENLNLGNVIGSVIVDETLSYELKCCVIQDRSFNTTLPPMVEARIYLFAEVPAAVAESFTNAEIRFGFQEGFSAKAEALDACDHLYYMDLSSAEGARNQVKIVVFEPVEYKLGDVIETDFTMIQFNEITVKNELKEKYKGSNYTFATDKGLKVLCLIGTIKNLNKEEYNPCFSGSVSIDGYKYDIKDWELCKGLKVSPLNEVPLYIFAEVPAEVVDNCSNIVFQFGFEKNFTNNTFSDFEACEFAYELSWDRPAE